MKVVKVKDRAYRELQSQKTGEKFSLSAVLSESLGAKDLFVHHEVLSPGRRSSSPHRHTGSDEFVYVLKGRPTVVEGCSSDELGPGDAALFLSASQELHFIENRTDEVAEFLVVSSRAAQDDAEFS